MQEEKKVNPGINQDIKKIETKIKNAERKITELEEAQAKALKALEKTDFNDADRYATALKKYEASTHDLNEAVEKWESLELELEAIQALL